MKIPKQLKNQKDVLAASLLSIPQAFVHIVSRKKYWKFILLSILLNIAVFIGLIIIGFSLFAGALEASENVLDQQLAKPVEGILYIFFIIISAFLTAMIFSTIATIANSPIFDAITDNILKDKNIEDIRPDQGIFSFIFDITRSFKFESKKLILLCVFTLIIFAVNFIPGVGNFLFYILNQLNFVVMVGIDVFDPPLARADFRFRDKMYFIVSHPGLWPFLFLTGFINSIPLLNLVTIPIFIVASVILFAKIHKDYQS